MAATAPEIVAAQSVVPESLLDRGNRRCVSRAHERYRERPGLPKRAVAVDLRSMAGGPPLQPSLGIDRPFGERHRRALSNAALFDGRHNMVARNKELASEPDGEPGSAFCAHELGLA